MGRLSDMYGGKRMFVIGIGWLVIWSIIAGISHSELLIVFARGLQGLGPAAFLPSSVMLLGSVYRPGPRKNLVGSITRLGPFESPTIHGGEDRSTMLAVSWACLAGYKPSFSLQTCAH